MVWEVVCRAVVCWDVAVVSMFLLVSAPGERAQPLTAATAGPAMAVGADSLQADPDRFHASLAAYGMWVDSKSFGKVWTPKPYTHGWKPYTVGRWAYTDQEWTWVSDEPWGWATFHYGRWAFEAPYGWVWIPGSVWAPAWVAWRAGEGLVGWAPLPPGADPVSDTDLDLPIEPLAFTFVHADTLPDEHMSRRYEPIARTVTYMAQTKNVTRYTIAGGRVVDHGVAVEEIEETTKHGVKRETVPILTEAPAVSPAPKDKSKDKNKGKPESPKAMGRRHGRERSAFAAAEAEERKELELRHRAEVKTPPEGVFGNALQRQHEAENSMQMDHERREWQALEWRQKEEGDVPIPPPPPPHHKRKT
jgi:hypothetical protein